MNYEGMNFDNVTDDLRKAHEDYHVIEVNLEDENLLQEMKVIMSTAVEVKGFMEACRFEIDKEV